MTFPFPPAVAVDNMEAYSEMQRIQHTAVILYVWWSGTSGKDIHEDMVQTLQDDVPSYATVGCRNQAKQGKTLKMSCDWCLHRQRPQRRKLQRSIKLSWKVSVWPSEWSNKGLEYLKNFQVRNPRCVDRITSIGNVVKHKSYEIC